MTETVIKETIYFYLLRIIFICSLSFRARNYFSENAHWISIVCQSMFSQRLSFNLLSSLIRTWTRNTSPKEKTSFSDPFESTICNDNPGNGAVNFRSSTNKATSLEE